MRAELIPGSERELAFVEHVLEGEPDGDVEGVEPAFQRDEAVGDGDGLVLFCAGEEEEDLVLCLSRAGEEVRTGDRGFVDALEPAAASA